MPYQLLATSHGKLSPTTTITCSSEIVDEGVLSTGVINIDGTLWKDQRRFLHEKLRKFGMTLTDSGRAHMETRIMVRKHFVQFWCLTCLENSYKQIKNDSSFEQSDVGFYTSCKFVINEFQISNRD